MKDLRIYFSAFVVVATVFVLSTGADAQTRRKRTTTRATPVVSATPPLGDVQIISQASDQNLLDPATIGAVQTQPTVETDPNVQKIRDLNSRIKKLEAARTNEYDDGQKRLLLNLDILTRAEQRSESLRKQLFEMIEKENSVKSRLDEIASDLRPEAIQRSANFAGTMRPEEIRELRQKSLDSERRNLDALLIEIQSTRSNIASTLQKSDILVDKLRLKLEKDIDDSFIVKDELDN